MPCRCSSVRQWVAPRPLLPLASVHCHASKLLERHFMRSRIAPGWLQSMMLHAVTQQHHDTGCGLGWTLAVTVLPDFLFFANDFNDRLSAKTSPANCQRRKASRANTSTHARATTGYGARVSILKSVPVFSLVKFHVTATIHGVVESDPLASNHGVVDTGLRQCLQYYAR